MRLTPIILLFAIVGGYLLSVPLFGHKYGVLDDGRVTRILTQKDAEICAAAGRTPKTLLPPIAAEVEETSQSQDVTGDLRCDLKPVKSVSWDWLYLPKTALRRCSNIQDAAGVLTAIPDVIFSKYTWEVAAGIALTLSSLLLIQLLWRS